MPKSDIFAKRAIPTIFLGYLELQKGYVLLDIKSKKFLVSRDVVFHETIFPFSTKEVYTNTLIDVCGSPLDVADSSMMDCDLDVTTDTKVHHTNDDNDVNTNDDVDIEVLHDKGGAANTDHDDSTTNIPIFTEIVRVPTTSVRRTSRIVKEPVWR